MVLSVRLKSGPQGNHRSHTQKAVSSADSHHSPVLLNQKLGAWVFDQHSRWFCCPLNLRTTGFPLAYSRNTQGKESPQQNSPLSYRTLRQVGVLENTETKLLVFLQIQKSKPRDYKWQLKFGATCVPASKLRSWIHSMDNQLSCC